MYLLTGSKLPSSPSVGRTFFGLGAASKWICFYAGGGLAIMFLISIIQRIIEYKKVMAYGTPEEEEKVSHFPGI